MKKTFLCPNCSKKFPWYVLFTLKEHITCSKCGNSYKPKKKIVSFQQGVFIGFLSFYAPFQIMMHKDYSFFASVFVGLVISLINLIIICVTIYRKSDFEEYK